MPIIVIDTDPVPATLLRITDDKLVLSTVNARVAVARDPPAAAAAAAAADVTITSDIRRHDAVNLLTLLDTDDSDTHTLLLVLVYETRTLSDAYPTL